MRRFAIGLLLLAVVAAAVWYGWGQFQAKAEPLAFTRAVADRGTITQTITASGSLQPLTSVQVGSQVSGQLREVLVDFNVVVKAGQVIARIDPATFEANLLQAEGNLQSAQATLELQRLNADRIRELVAKALVAQQADDTAQAELLRAEAQVKIAEASVLRARTDLERCTIVAPIDGVVIARNIDVGQTVAASLNAPTLFVIAQDLSRMQVLANVAEADVGSVREGQRVTFTVDAFPLSTFEGRVAQVRFSPREVENVVTYTCVIDVENPGLRLKPGMTATVGIVVAERADVVRVPNSALRVRLPEGAFEPAAAEAPAAAGTPAGAISGGASAPAAPGGGAPADGSRRGPRGEGGGRGSRPPGAGRAAEAAAVRTVYVLPAEGGPEARPQARLVRVGISDGGFSEVMSGLEPGQAVVTGLASTARPGGTGSVAPTPSPFGRPPGGGGPFGR